MDRLEAVFHTGLQTLVVMGAGWAAARYHLLEPSATVQQAVTVINVLVMRLCLPALQMLLLGFYTDMRTLENWRLLGAFMIWTAIIQAGCGVWVMIFEGGRLERWGLHAMVLAANNTGILAPVVLDAALGNGSGYIGMLATVCLYFQQLPVSEALMAAGNARSSSPAGSVANGLHEHCPALKGTAVKEEVMHRRRREDTANMNHDEDEDHVLLFQDILHRQDIKDRADVHEQGKSVTNCNTSMKGIDASHHNDNVGSHMNGITGSNTTTQAAKPVDTSFAAVLLKNPLVWTTGAAAVISAMGVGQVVMSSTKQGSNSTTGNLAGGQFAFVLGSLEWLSRCSVPLTLLSTGLWLHGKTSILGQSNRRLVLAYMLLKLFVLPWLMAAVTWMMGITGKGALALLLLTVVPVGQTGFVISERYQVGTEAVTATLIAGLLLLLPHLLLVLWFVNKIGLYTENS